MNVVISLNKFTAILIFLLAVVYIFLTEEIGAGHSAGGMVDAKFIPRLIAGALLICSICIFFEKDKKKINFGIGKSILKVFIVFAFLLAYAFLLPILKWEICTLLFLISLMCYLADVVRIKLILIISVLVTAILYTIFIKMMYIPFPTMF